MVDGIVGVGYKLGNVPSEPENVTIQFLVAMASFAKDLILKKLDVKVIV